MPFSPALRRLRQEEHKFRAGLGYIAVYRLSLGYTVRVCLRTSKEKLDCGSFRAGTRAKCTRQLHRLHNLKEY